LDLRGIAGLGGAEGVIVGEPLYAGAFTLPEALAALG
jgi:phosphoribosylformimino-5-aminoimidazole carboxamide ribonucleotide (ProFAR) isomerase